MIIPQIESSKSIYLAKVYLETLNLDFKMSDGSGVINQAGVDHYNKLIDALLAKGKNSSPLFNQNSKSCLQEVNTNIQKK